MASSGVNYAILSGVVERADVLSFNVEDADDVPVCSIASVIYRTVICTCLDLISAICFPDHLLLQFFYFSSLMRIHISKNSPKSLLFSSSISLMTDTISS